MYKSKLVKERCTNFAEAMRLKVMKLHEQTTLHSTRITVVDGVTYTRQGETRKRHISEVQRGANGKSKKIERVQKWRDKGEDLQKMQSLLFERSERSERIKVERKDRRKAKRKK